MQHIIRLFTLIFFLNSCNDSSQFIRSMEIRPSIRVNGQKMSMDSIKLSATSTKKQGYLFLELADEYNSVQAIGVSYSGRGRLEHEGKTLDSDTELPAEHTRGIQLSYFNEEPGNWQLFFTVENAFGKTDSATYSVFCFQNLPPIAKLAAKAIEKGSWLLDASNSYDPDFNQGGGVVSYQFEVDGQTITTTKNQINYSFQQAGTYPVRLIVTDNDGQHSEPITTTIQIQKRK